MGSAAQAKQVMSSGGEFETSSNSKFPVQTKYIIGNEACERFSFYGMRSILVVFMTGHLMIRQDRAQAAYHLFAGAVYLLPILGAYISDRFLGKYRTILYLSLVYCLGHLVLSMWESQSGLYFGLGLIAIGSGGIKPCVSALVGDQFNEKNSDLIRKVFDLFYWSINFGSFFSTLLIPFLLVKYGPRVAFGIPGVLMAIATVIFWMGRKNYVQVPPARETGTAGFVTVFWYALTHASQRKPGQSFLDVARAKYTEEEVEGVKAVASIIKVFGTVSVFWALFDQSGSSWVLQAEKMNLDVMGMHLEASQLQAVNPILVMILIPIFGSIIYPAVQKLGVRVTPLRKMATGMVLAGVSFVIVGMLQAAIDSGMTVSVLWQIVPYIVITCSEVMISITGLEFAYTQAPKAMKSTIMSFWLVTVFIGNLLDATIAGMNVFHGAMYFYFFAGLMFLVSIAFIWTAARYRVRNFLEGGDQTLAAVAS